jgi:hypothetical protein
MIGQRIDVDDVGIADRDIDKSSTGIIRLPSH